MRYKLSIITILFSLFISAQSENSLPNSVYDFSNSDRIIAFQKQIIKDKITGSNQALVFKDGEIVFNHIENSFIEGDHLISNETIFPIWSMSKPITIVAMMILFEKGLIDFDDPVSKYIPVFNKPMCKNVSGTYPCENELKLIHLMNHRSGYVYYDRYYIDVIQSKDLEELMNKIAKQPLEIEPGSKFLYGINQSILGRLIEVVSGKSFYDFLKDNIFDPLEMNKTKFYLTEDERKQIPPLFIKNQVLEGFLSDGITSKGDILTYYKDNLTHLGGEGLISSMTDFFNFTKMLLNNGSFKGKRIISSKSIEMITQNYSNGYPDEENGFQNLLGFYYGFSVWVLKDSSIMNLYAPEGIYGWGGYHGTEFWIDPTNSLFAVFMTRALSNYESKERFIRAVYKDLN
ncbi:MAG: hypothetical protein CMC32_01855 [Flavobacteriaceae bacterium]|nr:hypothetical protein [Flavobacteriaceae bacterium]|tara:strand:- start:3814 stop:5019 length:1206 start_codon:yes stop_codon:yes gene_type:complete